MHSEELNIPNARWLAWRFLCIVFVFLLVAAPVIFYIVLSNTGVTQEKEANQKTDVVNPRLLVAYIDYQWSNPWIRIKWSRPGLLDQNATITLQNTAAKDAMVARLVHNGRGLRNDFTTISQQKETVIAYGKLRDVFGMSSIDIQTVGPTKATLRIHFESDQNGEALQKTNICIWWLSHGL